MKVYVIGGFLGSGKTSLMMKLATHFIDKGERVALLVNESGEVGVDGATLKAQGYDAIELPSGCICCTLAGDLIHSLTNIKNDIDPDVLMIEPTGLALPHKVKDMIRSACVDEEFTKIIGIADIQRFDDLIKKKEDFFTRQMHAAEFVMINKADLAKPGQIESATQWLNNAFPGKPVLPVSVKEGTNLDKVYEMMEQ